MSMFPTSERLKKILNFAKKHRLQDEIARLRRELATRPSPLVYSQLAEIYQELGKAEQALGICEECIEKYPLNENPYLIIGEVRLGRFFSDLIAHDGLQAERQLRRVVKLNQQNVKAHMFLAQLAFAVGAYEESVKSIDSVLALSPGVPDLEAFQAGLAKRKGGEEDEGLTVADRIRQVEHLGSLVNQPDDFPGGRILPQHDAAGQAKLDEKALGQSMREIGRTPGVTNAVVVDREGQTLAGYTDAESIPVDAFTELVTEVVATSEDAARRMDVGKFQWCSLEGDFGGVAISRAKNLSVALMFTPQVKTDRAQSILEDFTSRNLTSPGEVPRA
jgi:tetratricopeptide (TPR) repeat protein